MHKVVDFVLLLAYVEPWCFGTGEVALRGNRTAKNGGVFVLSLQWCVGFVKYLQIHLQIRASLVTLTPSMPRPPLFLGFVMMSQQTR